MTDLFVFSQALRENLRFRRLLPWIFLGFFTFILGSIWLSLEPSSNAEDAYSQILSLIVFRGLALAAAVYSTGIVSQEVEQRTIVYLLSRPVPRARLLVARYASAAIPVSIVGMFCVVMLSLACYHGVPPNQQLFRDCLAVILGSFAYCAVFLLVSLLLNRALLFCLIYAFAWEPAVPNLKGSLYETAIFSYTQGIASPPRGASFHGLGASLIAVLTGTAADNQVQLGPAVLTLVSISIVALVIGTKWFTRFEYVPREDAE
jgi:ABC-2 type transport system permease protein